MAKPQPQKKFETPYNEDAERAVLGSILIDGNGTFKKIGHILSANDFYEETHRVLFEHCKKLYDAGVEPDLLTIHDALKQSGWDMNIPVSILTELTNYVPTTSHSVNYAKIVAKYAAARRILAASRDIAQLTQEDITIDELVSRAETRLKGVTRGAVQAESKFEIVDLQPYMTMAREHREPEGQIKGISTGLKKVDAMTQGFVPGELMIVSGQTSHGKTQLSNNIMLAAAKNDHKVMFITMEMTKQETADRFNMLTRDEDIGEGKIFLNMRSDLAYTDVTKLIEKAKEKGCDMVVIDHLHYFSRSVENATQEVSKIVKEFKSAAIVYELPIILICHVRKMAPKKHPTIQDLRDSSLIAQDADMVLIVWRDESPGATNPNEVEVTLWKNRNRQKKHRRDFLYADGMTLVENDPRPADDKERQRQAANTARMTGDKDMADLDLELFGEDDIDIPDF
jgi:replicative DNA helicase